MTLPGKLSLLVISFLSFACNLEAQAGLQFLIPQDRPSATYEAPINEALNSISSRLPPLWLAGLPTQIRFTIESLSTPQDMNNLCKPDGSFQFGLGKVVFGYTDSKSKIIHLNKSLFDETSHCTSAQLSTLLQRTLVHEMSHIYDYKAESLCGKISESYNCLRKFKVSDDLQFLLLSGFKPTVITDRPVISSKNNAPRTTQGKDLLQTERMNIFFDRSPRSYEASNPQECFAVNMEFFLTDPEYKCRRPATFDYLSQHFNFDPYPEKSCSEIYQVFSGNGKVLSIDLSRVYAIDYMLTSPGSSIQSHWGHTLLRLVICAPGIAFGEACRQDLKSHIIVDFAAQLFDENLSLIGGLMGKYPSAINFRTFKAFQQETMSEIDRDFITYPLLYGQKDVESLTKTILEKYWNQASRYKFMTNNCATQVLYTILAGTSWKTLSKSPLTSDLFSPDHVSTPEGLKTYLNTIGLIRLRNYRAEDNYDFYPSMQTTLDNLKIKKTAELKAEPRPERRLQFYQGVLAKTAKSDLPNVQRGFIIIEKIHSSMLKQKMMAFLTEVQTSLQENHSIHKRSMRNSMTALNPRWDGYGIPQHIDELLPEISKAYAEERDSVLKGTAQGLTPSQRNQLDAIQRDQAAIQANMGAILSR